LPNSKQTGSAPSSAVSAAAMPPVIPQALQWNYSPHPLVEETLNRIRQTYPPHLPAGLERFSALLSDLGNPHLSLPPVFHVAGTNGKGSTVAFLQAIFESAGKTVHRFTSPHLVRFSERIVINGRQISDDLLLSLIAELEKTAKPEEISFFEFFTALAFMAYARHPADAVLLETGLGGTLDATNVVPQPAASIITRISFDHMRVLGDTLPAIARQKAGIIKQNCPVIVAPQSDEALETLFAKAAAVKQASLLLQAGRDFFVMPTPAGFEYRSQSVHVSLPLPALAGHHQLLNAATAIAALEAGGFADICTTDVLSRAMQQVRWPGRMQKLTRGVLADMLPQGWELWLDGAHNDSGADVLAAHIRSFGTDMPVHLVTAYKDKKDTHGFYARLSGLFQSTTVADFAIDAPMVAAADVAGLLQNMGGFDTVSTAPDIQTALAQLVAKHTAPQRVMISGSLYLVGHALKVNGDPL
jgi:dihydrofolate synthase / folylpolyglutamate synthase